VSIALLGGEDRNHRLVAVILLKDAAKAVNFAIHRCPQDAFNHELAAWKSFGYLLARWAHIPIQAVGYFQQIVLSRKMGPGGILPRPGGEGRRQVGPKAGAGE